MLSCFRFPIWLFALAGCTVYSPTVPSTPLVRKGQVEVVAAMRTLLSLDGSVAYSPANHMLISAEAAIRSGGGNMTVNGMKVPYTDRHRQGSLGIGTYQEFGPERRFYAAAVSGIGMATVNVHNGLFGQLSEYTASYNKYYTQLYVAQRGGFVTGGVSLRTTWLDFNQLRLDGAPIEPVTQFYIEPSFFVQAGKGALQSQLTIGISVPARRSTAYDSKILAAQSSLVSVGLVFRPGLLREAGAAL